MHEELVARGRPRHAWRAVAGCLATGLVLGVVCGVAAAVVHRGDDPGASFLAWLAVVGFGFLGAAVLYGVGWAAWPGGVRYSVVGTRVLVHRWGIRVREVETDDLAELVLSGAMTWRAAFTSPTMFGRLPRVTCVRREPDGIFGGTTDLPAVLLWGAEETDAFFATLTAALRRSGVEATITRRS